MDAGSGSSINVPRAWLVMAVMAALVGLPNDLTRTPEMSSWSFNDYDFEVRRPDPQAEERILVVTFPVEVISAAMLEGIIRRVGFEVTTEDTSDDTRARVLVHGILPKAQGH